MKITLSNRILLALSGLLILSMALIKIGDYDIWYHLRVGQHILSTGSIKHLEPFSFAVTDIPWSLQSWLAGVIFYMAYSLGGINGLILFNALMVSAVFVFIYMTMRLKMSEGSVPLMVLLILIAAFTVRFRMFARPHIFEFLFLSASLYLLNFYRIRGKNYLFIIPFIQLLWVNIHGSHILGILLPLVFLAGQAASAYVDKEGNERANFSRFARAMVLLLCVNIVFTLLNPTTYQALIFPFMLTGQKVYMQNIGEWQPLSASYLWGYGLRYTWGFSVLTVLGVAGFIWRRKDLDITGVLLFAGFFIMALKGIRLMAEFAIVSAPVVFWGLQGVYARYLKRAEGRGAAAVLLLIFFVASPLVFLSDTYSLGLGVKKNIFPENAVNFIEKEDIKGNMFNSFGFGDYLVWRVFPERKVLIHGRNEVFTEAFYQEYLKAHKSPEKWNELADRFKITYALLEYYLTDYEGKATVEHLAGNPGWVPVYWDRLAIVYVKDIPENRTIINKWGYRRIFPSYLDFSYLDGDIAKGRTGEILSELGRLINSSPDNEEAFLARAYVYFRLGKKYYSNSIEDIKSALKINHGRAMTHAALGMLHARNGDREEAINAYENALAIDPKDPAALQGIGELKNR